MEAESRHSPERRLDFLESHEVRQGLGSEVDSGTDLEVVGQGSRIVDVVVDMEAGRGIGFVESVAVATEAGFAVVVVRTMECISPSTLISNVTELNAMVWFLIRRKATWKVSA